MDSQCDRCGRELPAYEMSPEQAARPDLRDFYEGVRVGWHLTLGEDNRIFPDGNFDFDPGDEYDLCPQCRDEFRLLWNAFYDQRVVPTLKTDADRQKES